METLDHFEKGDKNFRSAKTILHCLLIAFLASVIFIVTLRVFPVHLDRNIIGVIGSVLVLILMALAPTGLFYIIRSYSKKEEHTKRRLLYLAGIIFFNLVFVWFVYTAARDLSKILN